MYCPQCGQQQASTEMRFCSRCGFALSGVAQLLALGGELPAPTAASKEKVLSPRQRGVRQGAMLMLSTLLVVPIMAIISVFIFHNPEFFVPIAAVGCMMGGLLRMIYALMFESTVPIPTQETQAYVPPQSPQQLRTGARVSALPPQRSVPVSDYTSRRATTAELVPPPSVTENTTRLLDEEKATKSKDEG